MAIPAATMGYPEASQPAWDFQTLGVPLKGLFGRVYIHADTHMYMYIIF